MNYTVSINGNVTTYFNDETLYKKFVESEEECQMRIREFISELLNTEEE